MDRFRYVLAVNRKWNSVWRIEFRSICEEPKHRAYYRNQVVLNVFQRMYVIC